MMLGSLCACSNANCTFQIMKTPMGWLHVDTHGIDTSDHDPVPER